MKICGLTQTYGERKLEMDVFLSNNQKIQTMKSLDGFRMNFHNSNLLVNYEEKLKNSIPGIMCHDVLGPYGFTIFKTLMELKIAGYTDILFMEDDHFFIEHKKANETIDSVISFYKEHNFPLVYLGRRFDPEKFLAKSVINFNGNVFGVYDSKNLSAIYPYDGSPHIGNIDFLLENVYKKQNTNLDPWNLELKNAQYFRDNSFDVVVPYLPTIYLANFSGRNVATRMSVENKKRYIAGEIFEDEEVLAFHSHFKSGN